jgi:hypothetical protein
MGNWPISRPVPTHRTPQQRKTRTHVHASSGIRTRDPTVWLVQDHIHLTHLRPRGQWGRRYSILLKFKHFSAVAKKRLFPDVRTHYHTMMTCGRVEIQLHGFLTSALDGGEWSASRPYRFIPGERATNAHWTGGWADSRVGLDAVAMRKISLPVPEIEPQSSSS